MKILSLLYSFLIVFGIVRAFPWDLDFDFTGYSKKTEILVTDCNQDMRSLANLALAGKTTTACISEPTVNQNLTHVDCTDDSVMEKALRFTMYITDDERGGATDRQRLEMRVFDPSPEDYKGYNNTNFIYSWWFKLDSNPPLKAPSDFFHIFQLKPVGSSTMDSFPIMTLTLNDTNGLHIRMRRDDRKNLTMEENFEFYPMISLDDALGRWLQVMVESQNSNGNYADSPNPGYVRVVLKDLDGVQLYPTQPDEGLIYCNMFWDDMDYQRPKWGLYRRLNDDHNPIDTELYQNIQIWKKDE